MKEPTKADLAAAVARLTEENAGLRDMLAAVSHAADSVPTAAAGVPDWKELRRARDILGSVKVIADPGGSWAWGHASGEAAKYLREQAAEPVGYEAYQPEDEPAQVAGDVKCLDKYDRLGNTDYCQRLSGHDGQHVGHMNRRWTAASVAP